MFTCAGVYLGAPARHMCVYNLNTYDALLCVLYLYMCICADLWMYVCPDENGTRGEYEGG